MMALSGELYQAHDLRAWGAIDNVVARADLHPLAEQFARKLATGPTLAYAAVKKLARAYTADGIPGADRLLLDAAIGLFDTDDARRGIETFLGSGSGPSEFAGR
jgi:enoyl-CoA hydratase/carnithine racemase